VTGLFEQTWSTLLTADPVLKARLAHDLHAAWQRRELAEERDGAVQSNLTPRMPVDNDISIYIISCNENA
jgi:hypothetical protein